MSRVSRMSRMRVGMRVKKVRVKNEDEDELEMEMVTEMAKVMMKEVVTGMELELRTKKMLRLWIVWRLPKIEV